MANYVELHQDGITSRVEFDNETSDLMGLVHLTDYIHHLIVPALKGLGYVNDVEFEVIFPDPIEHLDYHTDIPSDDDLDEAYETSYMYAGALNDQPQW